MNVNDFTWFDYGTGIPLRKIIGNVQGSIVASLVMAIIYCVLE